MKQKNVGFQGVTESINSAPSLYKNFIKLKRLVYNDTDIGILEYVKGAHLINIGSGPSLNMPHLELDLDAPASITNLDLSFPYVRNIHQENRDKKISCLVADVLHIPYRDKQFDVAFIPYVIHHVPGLPPDLLSEVARVTKKHIIVFDHIKSSQTLYRSVQENYWKIFDGGCNYQTESEWETALKDFLIVKKVRTGALFSQVIKLVLQVTPKNAG